MLNLKEKKYKIINVNTTSPYPIFFINDYSRDVSIIVDNIGFFNKKILIITDNNVFKLYGKEILQSFKRITDYVNIIIVRPGENSKSLKYAEYLYGKAIEYNIDKKSLIVAFGGGVIGDLAGFIAATYMRGIDFIQIPTTLLAQVDSSIGGKVAVNHKTSKNLIGIFHQPKAVIINSLFLETLCNRQYFAGIAEIIKTSIIIDKNLFSYINDNLKFIQERNWQKVNKIILDTCKIKAKIIQKDEWGKGHRNILNFGHTLAHAIEIESNYSYLHGEAVSIGMYAAALLSYELGIVKDKDMPKKIKASLTAFNLPIKVNNCNSRILFNLLLNDKKNYGNKIRWVLIESIGKLSNLKQAPDKVIKKIISQISS